MKDLDSDVIIYDGTQIGAGVNVNDRETIVPEFDFEFSDLVSDSNNCLFCQKARRANIAICLCSDCYEYMTMSGYEAKKNYHLTLSEIKTLRSTLNYMGPHGMNGMNAFTESKHYLIKDIRMKAFRKHYDEGDIKDKSYYQDLLELHYEKEFEEIEKKIDPNTRERNRLHWQTIIDDEKQKSILLKEILDKREEQREEQREAKRKADRKRFRQILKKNLEKYPDLD